MQRKKEQFSEHLKRSIVEQVLSGTISKEQARRHYGIKSKSGVLHWLRNYQKYGICSLTSVKEPIHLKKHKPLEPDKSSDELRSRIAQLEQMLEDEQLRSEAYSRMIEIAERELKVPIRKKSSTK